jgi:hypothetical protein
VPAATAVHQVGHSSRTARAASIRAFHESAYLYYATHVRQAVQSETRNRASLLTGAVLVALRSGPRIAEALRARSDVT